MKYLRPLRLGDQYIQFGCAVASGVYLQIKDWWILYWAIAATFISITAFMINEVTDRQDVDINSWNNIHIQKNIKFNNWILALIFILFSVLGLYIAHLVNLFWWGFAMYLIGICYSLKPIRLKGRLILDIFAQLSIWWLIPFLAPISQLKDISSTATFTITLTLLIWSIFYPYQLADYQADLKAGLKPTHIIIGMKNSLVFGAILAILGLFFYVKLKFYLTFPWSIVFPALTCYLLYLYIKWLRMNNIAKQIKSIQKAVLIIKPLTQLLVPYLLVFYFL